MVHRVQPPVLRCLEHYVTLIWCCGLYVYKVGLQQFCCVSYKNVISICQCQKNMETFFSSIYTDTTRLPWTWPSICCTLAQSPSSLGDDVGLLAIGLQLLTSCKSLTDCYPNCCCCCCLCHCSRLRRSRYTLLHDEISPGVDETNQPFQSLVNGGRRL